MQKSIFRNLALMLVAGALLLPALASAGTSVDLEPTANDGILVFESQDGMFKWWVDSRVYLDMAMYMDDAADLAIEMEEDEDLEVGMASGIQIRRARMAWKAILWNDWYAEVDVDFAEEATALKDAYIRYDNLFDRQGYVRVGNFRAPFGLEENTSSRYLMFMERSQGTDPFVPGRRLGAEVAYWGDMYRIALGALGPDAEDFETNTDDQIEDGQSDMNWSFAGRATVAPIMDEHKVLHIGGAYAMMKPTFTDEDGIGEVRFRTRNETHISNHKLVSTGKMKDTESWTVFGGELGFVMDRLMIQGEYMGSTVAMCEDFEYDDPSFTGMYGFVSYFLTDDSHPYSPKLGEFTGVKPTGENGAVELAARYSMVNLTDEDADIMGGESTALTFGVNWYPNSNIKIMANYSMIDNDEDSDADGDFIVNEDGFDYGIFQMRVQAAF